MEPSSNYYCNNQGGQWTEKHHWVKTSGKTPNEVLKEIHDELSPSLDWKKNSELCDQVRFLLHLKYDNGIKTSLFHHMDQRIEGLEKCSKFKLPRKISEIIYNEVKEAKFNIEYFLMRTKS